MLIGRATLGLMMPASGRITLFGAGRAGPAFPAPLKALVTASAGTGQVNGAHPITPVPLVARSGV